MMLTFVGLGLYDERDVTLKGRDAIADADSVFAEFYTSVLPAAPLGDLEEFHGVPIQRLSRADVEDRPDEILAAADDGDAVVLVGGDPMVSTTHADLRLRALDRGIDTHVIHGQSIQTAVSGITGLQNYRFGRSTTLPFPDDGWTPSSPFGAVAENLARDLHTLIYLDIDDGTPEDPDDRRYLAASDAATAVAERSEIEILVAVARAGSEDPIVAVGRPAELAERDLGPPLHVMIAPAELHDVERALLEKVADGTVPDRERAGDDQ